MKRKGFGVMSLFFLLLASIGLVLVIKQIQKTQDTRIGAVASGVELYFNPDSASVLPGDELSMDIIMDTDAHQPYEVSGVEVYVKYDPTIITVSEFAINEIYNPLDYPQLIRPKFDNSLGVASFALGVHPENDPPYFSGCENLATITFTGVSEGEGIVEFDEATQVGVDGQNVADDTLDVASVTVVQTSANVPTLKFSPPDPDGSQSVGQEFATKVLMSTPDTIPIEAVDARITFDTTALEVVRIDEPTSPRFSLYQATSFDNNSGNIVISASVPYPAAELDPTPAPVVGAEVELATLVLRLKAVSNGASMNFVFEDPPAIPPSTNDSNLIRSNQSDDPVDVLAQVENFSVVIVNAPTPFHTPTSAPTPTPLPTNMPTPLPTATPTSTPTPTPTSAPPQSLTTKMRFQGKHASRNLASTPIQLAIKNANGELVACNDNLETTCNVNLNSTGNFTIAIVPGQYTWRLSSPGYLNRTYSVSVESGVDTLDITGLPLIAGDLNNDTVVNEVDYAEFVAQFLSNDPVVDLDGSGEVNNYDFSVMRPNWFEESDNF